jgi:hypothetical protein
MDAVYNVAESTGLFAANDIKVRLQPYQYYRLGEGKKFSSCLWIYYAGAEYRTKGCSLETNYHTPYGIAARNFISVSQHQRV